MTVNEMIMYDTIVEYGIATTEEINLVRCIVSGTWEEILNSIVYARVGYKTLDQYIECEVEEE